MATVLTRAYLRDLPAAVAPRESLEFLTLCELEDVLADVRRLRDQYVRLARRVSASLLEEAERAGALDDQPRRLSSSDLAGLQATTGSLDAVLRHARTVVALAKKVGVLTVGDYSF